MSSYAVQERPEKRAERLRTEQGTVRCALCPWQATGSMLGVMERAKVHRAKTHPQAPVESNIRWRNEPPKGKEAPVMQREERAEPSLRERAIARLRERGESTAAEVAADLGEGTGNVSAAFGWAARAGLVDGRSGGAGRGKLWRPAGTEAGRDSETPPAAVLSVEDALAAAGRPMTVDEVTTATGRNKTSVWTSLTKAVAAGRAERVGRGVYRSAS